MNKHSNRGNTVENDGSINEMMKQLNISTMTEKSYTLDSNTSITRTMTYILDDITDYKDDDIHT